MDAALGSVAITCAQHDNQVTSVNKFQLQLSEGRVFVSFGIRLKIPGDFNCIDTKAFSFDPVKIPVVVSSPQTCACVKINFLFFVTPSTFPFLGSQHCSL